MEYFCFENSFGAKIFDFVFFSKVLMCMCNGCVFLFIYLSIEMLIFVCLDVLELICTKLRELIKLRLDWSEVNNVRSFSSDDFW